MKPWHDKWYTAEVDRVALEVFETERLSALIVDTVRTFMDTNDITNADLARALGVSRARVSQMLSRGANLTLGSLAALSVALHANFEINLVGRPGS